LNPRALKENPDRMRQSKSSPQADALMLPTIKAVGIVQFALPGTSDYLGHLDIDVPASTGLRCDSPILQCEHVRQMKEANHSRWVSDDPFATGSIDGADDVRGRLKLIDRDGEHVGHPVYNKSHRLSVHLHHHDRTALGRFA